MDFFVFRAWAKNVSFVKTHFFRTGIFRKKYKTIFQGKFLRVRPKSVGFISESITSFLLKKYKKSFLFRKYKNFFNIRARKYHFQKYKDFLGGWILFLGGLCWEVHCVAAFYTSGNRMVLFIMMENSLIVDIMHQELTRILLCF